MNYNTKVFGVTRLGIKPESTAPKVSAPFTRALSYYYGEVHPERRGLSPWLSAWTAQLRKNIAAGAIFLVYIMLLRIATNK